MLKANIQTNPYKNRNPLGLINRLNLNDLLNNVSIFDTVKIQSQIPHDSITLV